ncbi:chemoreceptor glutamine deamidase CheD [Nitrosomonas sp.]|uniref:chemoreceptor glutamine deamidase CheD n=1 Tax=Nitrosomonas sp. TaxID=42353 RepID=UPI001DF4DD36|nr:chemoreceptor glutamine deamidase CheD [Nitrosomonas sp.]MCB1948125.1 chemoreceptor glutamine deamidase CheD [Nitrosomonas sp.]MDR4513442.1 chemoreceptor glutamine deamidase CheD [Nitrosomonas sp.]
MIEIEDKKITSIDKQVATHFYYDKDLNAQAVKLLPGEYFVTDKDKLLVTVLGSCVAACIRDHSSGIGGMNHFMLPDGGSPNSQTQIGAPARYGTYAMEILINQLLKLGARRSNLEAKVFGGGNVLQELTHSNVGQRNADFVMRFLATENIRVVAKDLVDIYPRKVYFFPKTGKVLVKKLKDNHQRNIAEREKSYFKKVNEINRSNDSNGSNGSVELFS